MNLLMTMTDRPGTWKLQPAPAFISFCQADVNFIAYSHFTWTFIFQNPNWSGGNFILQLSINRMHNLTPLKNLEKSKDSDYIACIADTCNTVRDHYQDICRLCS